MAEPAKEYPICTFEMEGISHTLNLAQRDWDILSGDERFLPGCRRFAEHLRSSEKVSWMEMVSSLNYLVQHSMESRELFNFNYKGILDPIDGREIFGGFDGICNDRGPAVCTLELYKDRSSKKQLYVGSIDVRHHAFSRIPGLNGLRVHKRTKPTRMFEHLDGLLEFFQIGLKTYPDILLTDKKIAPDPFLYKGA